jgi:hypothetical protein
MFASLELDGNTPTSMASTASLASLPTPVVATDGPSSGEAALSASNVQAPAGDSGVTQLTATADTGSEDYQCSFLCGFTCLNLGEMERHEESCALKPTPTHATEDRAYACDFMCGFKGSFAVVSAHEENCTLKHQNSEEASPALQYSGEVTYSLDGGDDEQRSNAPAYTHGHAAERGSEVLARVRTSKPPATPASPGPVFKAHRSPMNRSSNYFKKPSSPAPTIFPPQLEEEQMQVSI